MTLQCKVCIFIPKSTFLWEKRITFSTKSTANPSYQKFIVWIAFCSHRGLCNNTRRNEKVYYINIAADLVEISIVIGIHSIRKLQHFLGPMVLHISSKFHVSSLILKEKIYFKWFWKNACSLKIASFAPNFQHFYT